MADSHPVFSPVCPILFVLYPAERTRQLKDYLPTEIGQVQRVNVKALVRMYEGGELGPRYLGDPSVYLEGKQVERISGRMIRLCINAEWTSGAPRENLMTSVGHHLPGIVPHWMVSQDEV
ncbi:hypothetical protein N7447_005411 [Penicillium robsamsonii]|uniref:uncharacterized protein n=1 Tax=Penicillium robsamsonii TaxID=1792511 RepID=UPI00254848CC|nr:uncharacterized protein N7447_005411 [Penicillium robsamsonii]KAJ5823071.1 hypothetical protein N7447_005411 [Penicillium robsamsonii]